jgi:hypothetical protein
MKRISKVLLLAGLMGGAVAGFMHAQDMGTPGLDSGWGSISFTAEEREAAARAIEQRQAQQQGQGNWIQFIETKDGKVYVMQLDGQIYVVVPRTDGNVEIVSRETNRARIDELNRLFEQRMR